MIAAIQFPSLSPELFSVTVFGVELALRWYALSYIAGILLGWWLVARALRRADLWPDDTPPLTPKQLEDLVTWIIIGVILGGRLGYVLFYQPAYFLQNPAEILMIWQGGMAFHGGLLGVVVAALLFAHRHAIPRLSLTDALCLGTPPGLLLGRIANFINAELWGRPTDVPWGVIFPGPVAQSCSGFEGACARHPSQLYEAGLEGLLLGILLIWLVWGRHATRSPGRVAGTFFAGYGLARFLVEFVRQPDAQFASPGNPLGLAWRVGGYGLTMGQVLSLPMILLGLWLILRSRRSAVPHRT